MTPRSSGGWAPAVPREYLDDRRAHPSLPERVRSLSRPTQTNVVAINESIGAYNAYQQSDVHSWWEFHYLGTNWIHPLYELPFTGGFPDNFGQPPDAFQDGEIGKLQSIVLGAGPSGEQQKPQVVGDNPNLPRDPDKFAGTSMRSASFASAASPVVSPMKSISMSTSDRLRLSRM